MSFAVKFNVDPPSRSQYEPRAAHLPYIVPAHELAQQRCVPVIPGSSDIAINARPAEKASAVEPPYKPVDVPSDLLSDNNENKHKAQTVLQVLIAFWNAAWSVDNFRVMPVPKVPAQQALANRPMNEIALGGSEKPDLRA
jgi:hypothetical protein